MQENIETLQDQLEQCRKDHDLKIDAINETRELLIKADQKKKDNPGERNRWSNTVSNLEATLYSNKRALTVVENQLIVLKRKLASLENRSTMAEVAHGAFQTEPEQHEYPTAAPPTFPGTASVQDRIDALIQHALDLPLFKIQEITRDECRLLRAFLDSPNSGKLPPNVLKELQKRVAIIERSQSGTNAKAGGFATQQNISAILQKCFNSDYMGLTLSEINQLKNYYEELVEQGYLEDSDKIRFSAAEKAMNEIRIILTRWLTL
jgi:hypothetical protein